MKDVLSRRLWFKRAVLRQLHLGTTTLQAELRLEENNSGHAEVENVI